MASRHPIPSPSNDLALPMDAQELLKMAENHKRETGKNLDMNDLMMILTMVKGETRESAVNRYALRQNDN